MCVEFDEDNNYIYLDNIKFIFTIVTVASV